MSAPLNASEIWESDNPAPLIWLATASIALVAHLGLLQVGITTYQRSQSGTDAPPATETKIIATALQLEGAEAPAPEVLDTTQPEPETAAPQSLQAETLTATSPAPQSLQSTLVPAPLAQTAQSLAPVATPVTANDPAPTPPPQRRCSQAKAWKPPPSTH